MSNKIYSLFQVYPYKGGDLSAKPNIRLDDIVNMLVEKVGGDEYERLAELSRKCETEEEFLEKASRKDVHVEYQHYAGNWGKFCGEVYEHVDNRLVELDINDFAEDVLKEIYNYEKE